MLAISPIASKFIRLKCRQAIAVLVYTVALLLDYLSDALERRRLRTLERICLEQARLVGLPESRAALEEMARNYRAAIDD